jgi:hypothetical protein
MSRAALLAVALALACSEEVPPPTQPLAFNHALHVGKRGIPCTECHPGADRAARAGLPSLPICLQCHMKPQGDPPSAREQVVRQLAADKVALRWTQVTRNPGHVYFSHRAHVGIAKMTCNECHGEVESWARPPERPNKKLMDMDACMGCHRQHGVYNGCRVCHH